MLLMLFAVGLASAQDRQQSDVQREEAEQIKLLQEGGTLLKARKPQEAIAHFDQVISFYEAKYAGSVEQIFCARGISETLFYLTKHANQNPKKNARVVRLWCDAQFLKGYTLVELGRISDARAALEAAVALSPANSQYLVELGNVYLREKNWPKALETFQTAEEAAQLADAPLRQTYVALAHRGIGYVLIEQGRLDEAEAKYKQSLELDPTSKLARDQLEYIRQLRAKGGAK
jgi:tetratricopeptide (TPR) repeat protein